MVLSESESFRPDMLTVDSSVSVNGERGVRGRLWSKYRRVLWRERNTSQLVQHIGTLVLQYTGTTVYWYTGTTVHWYTGTTVHGYTLHWYTGTTVHWYTLYWYTGTYYIGTLVLQYTNITLWEL